MKQTAEFSDRVTQALLGVPGATDSPQNQNPDRQRGWLVGIHQGATQVAVGGTGHPLTQEWIKLGMPVPFTPEHRQFRFGYNCARIWLACDEIGKVQ